MHIKPDLISEKFLPCVYLVSSTLSMTLSVTARMTRSSSSFMWSKPSRCSSPGEEAQLSLVGMTVLFRLQVRARRGYHYAAQRHPSAVERLVGEVRGGDGKFQPVEIGEGEDVRLGVHSPRLAVELPHRLAVGDGEVHAEDVLLHEDCVHRLFHAADKAPLGEFCTREFDHAFFFS